MTVFVEKLNNSGRFFISMLINAFHFTFWVVTGIVVALYPLLKGNEIKGDISQFVSYLGFSLGMVLFADAFLSIITFDKVDKSLEKVEQKKTPFNIRESLKELSSVNVLSQWFFFVVIMAVLAPNYSLEPKVDTLFTLNGVSVNGSQGYLMILPLLVWQISRALALEITDYDVFTHAKKVHTGYILPLWRGEKDKITPVDNKTFFELLAAVLAVGVAILVLLNFLLGL